MNQEINIDKLNTWLNIKGLGQRTIEEYLSYCQKFPWQFTQETITNFLNKHNNSIARAFLKHIIEYILTNDFPKQTKDNIKLNITIPKLKRPKRRKLPDVITKDEITQITNNMKTERDALMLIITFYGGLRVSELTKIKPYDFNWNTWINNPTEQGKLKITGKGKKQRYAIIPTKIMQRTYQYIKQYASKTQTKDQPLFNIGRKRWSIILAETSQTTIGRKINPHLIRHSTATWLSENKWRIEDIAEYLGHESITTAQIYTHITQTTIKNKFKKLTEQN